MFGMRAIAVVGLGALASCSFSWGSLSHYRLVPEQARSQAVEGKRAARAQVEIACGPGELKVRPGCEDVVRVDSCCNVLELEPVIQRQEFGRDLLVDVRPAQPGGNVGLWDLDEIDIDWDVSLTEDLPLDLGIDLGAGAGELELGGLALRSLRVDVGAAQVELNFASPNTERMDRMEIDAGAAEFLLHRLGNARCSHLAFTGAVGHFVVDLRGQWAERGHVKLDASLAEVELKVPKNLPVLIRASVSMGDFSPGGFMKQSDGAWVNRAYREAGEARVEIDVDLSLGELNVDTVDPDPSRIRGEWRVRPMTAPRAYDV